MFGASNGVRHQKTTFTMRSISRSTSVWDSAKSHSRAMASRVGVRKVAAG
jgi:hypothetical protein